MEGQTKRNLLDAKEKMSESLRQKLIDRETPGRVEFEPFEAELVGAFVEDAMSKRDARESAEGEGKRMEQERQADELARYIAEGVSRMKARAHQWSIDRQKAEQARKEPGGESEWKRRRQDGP